MDSVPQPDAERAFIGVIAGVGLSGSLPQFPAMRVDTPFGPTSGLVRKATMDGRNVAVLARRGDSDELQPHLVPYRANIWALASLGVRTLITSNACSGLRDTFPPGTFVISDQIIDCTAGRVSTFFESGTAIQVSTAHPFDPTLRGFVAEIFTARRLRFRDFGTTVVVGGPRFPTMAESRMHALIGGDVSNMTLMPETALALELGMSVLNISYVTDNENLESSFDLHSMRIDQIRRRAQQAESVLREGLLDLVRMIPTGYTGQSFVPQEAIDEVMAMQPIPARSA